MCKQNHKGRNWQGLLVAPDKTDELALTILARHTGLCLTFVLVAWKTETEEDALSLVA